MWTDTYFEVWNKASAYENNSRKRRPIRDKYKFKNKTDYNWLLIINWWVHWKSLLVLCIIVELKQVEPLIQFMHVWKMHTNLPQRRAGKTLRLEVIGALACKGKSSGKPVSFKWTRDKTHTHISGETRSRRVLGGFPSFWSNKYIWDIVNRETEMWRKLCVTKRWVTHQKVKTYTVEERERRLHGRQEHLCALILELREKMEGKNQKIRNELGLDLGILRREDQLLNF